MSSRDELIERGNKLADQYTESELKAALKNAIFMDDNEERLSIQWALKQKTGTTDGYAFTKEQQADTEKRLELEPTA